MFNKQYNNKLIFTTRHDTNFGYTCIALKIFIAWNTNKVRILQYNKVLKTARTKIYNCWYERRG